MQQAATEGAQTFDAHVYELYRSGVVGAEAALAAADSPNDMRLRIRLDAGASKGAAGIRLAPR
jgi:twitching motility protein PilU